MSYSSLVLARSPVGYWRLQETSGTSIADSSGNSLTGTLSGSGYTQGVTGIPGDAADLALQGSSDIAITVADNNLLDIGGAITLEVWFKHSSSNFSGLLICKSASIFSGLNNVTTYELGFLSGTLYFQYSDGTSANSINYNFTGVAANTWHLITATWTGNTATNGVKIMIDGAVAVQGTSPIVSIRTNSDPLLIMGKSGSANAYEHFPGIVSEAVVIAGATSLADHQAAYTAGITPPTATLSAGSGSFTLTGEAVAFAASHKLTAAQGSFALTGEAARLLYGRRFAVDQGSFVLTGQDIAFVRGFGLAAARGNFALSGQAVALKRQALLIAAAGGFSLAGQDADFSVGTGAFSMVADARVFTLTGQDANLSKRGRATAPPSEVSLVPVAPSGVISGKGDVNLEPS